MSCASWMGRTLLFRVASGTELLGVSSNHDLVHFISLCHQYMSVVVSSVNVISVCHQFVSSGHEAQTQTLKCHEYMSSVRVIRPERKTQTIIGCHQGVSSVCVSSGHKART